VHVHSMPVVQRQGTGDSVLRDDWRKKRIQSQGRGVGSSHLTGCVRVGEDAPRKASAGGDEAFSPKSGKGGSGPSDFRISNLKLHNASDENVIKLEGNNYKPLRPEGIGMKN